MISSNTVVSQTTLEKPFSLSLCWSEDKSWPRNERIIQICNIFALSQTSSSSSSSANPIWYKTAGGYGWGTFHLRRLSIVCGGAPKAQMRVLTSCVSATLTKRWGNLRMSYVNIPKGVGRANIEPLSASPSTPSRRSAPEHHLSSLPAYNSAGWVCG